MTLFFGVIVTLPASLNVFVKGKILLPLYTFHTEFHLFNYTMPHVIGITHEGLLLVIRISMRFFNSLSLAMLLIYTTPFVKIIKSLHIFKVPDLLLLVITLTYKFIFILSQTTETMYQAMKLRWWRKAKNTEAERIIAGRMVHVFRKSYQRYDEVFKAMSARGFTGEMHLAYLEKMKPKDFIILILLLIPVIILYCASQWKILI